MLYLILIDFANKQLKKTMMKKLLLLSMGAVMALQASAQDVTRLSTNLMDGQKQNSVSVVKRNPNIKTTANSVLTVTPITIGSAVNAFTQIGQNRRRVSVDQDLNAVVFVHRGDPAVAGSSGNKAMFDISTDGGANWTSNVGAVIDLEPAAPHTRYPQGAIMNPTAGNTNAANARIIGMAPKADGFNNGWGGLMQGTCKLDGTGSVKTYFNAQTGIDSVIPFIAAAAKFGLLIPLFTANAELYLFVSFITWWMVGLNVRKYNDQVSGKPIFANG